MKLKTLTAGLLVAGIALFPSFSSTICTVKSGDVKISIGPGVLIGIPDIGVKVESEKVHHHKEKADCHVCHPAPVPQKHHDKKNFKRKFPEKLHCPKPVPHADKTGPKPLKPVKPAPGPQKVPGPKKLGKPL